MTMMTMPTGAWLRLGQAHKRRWQGPWAPVPSEMGQGHHPACPRLRRQCKACPAVSGCSISRQQCLLYKGGWELHKALQESDEGSTKRQGRAASGARQGKSTHERPDRQLGCSERLLSAPSRRAGMAPGDRRPQPCLVVRCCQSVSAPVLRP